MLSFVQIFFSCEKHDDIFCVFYFVYYKKNARLLLQASGNFQVLGKLKKKQIILNPYRTTFCQTSETKTIY